MEIMRTPTLSKQARELHANQRKRLEQAIHAIVASPKIGTLKKGDLNGIYVYKFKIVNQLTLLASSMQYPPAYFGSTRQS